MFLVNLSRLAEMDADEAASWYDGRVNGLGLRFIEDLHQAIRSIQKNSLLPALYKKGSKVRKKSLGVFPYKIFYLFVKKEIFVIAIIHHKRSSKYMGRRLK